MAHARPRKRSRRQEAILRRQRREWRWRVGAGVVALAVLALITWAIVGAVQRTSVVRAAESRPPVRGTPVEGGQNMALVPPTPVPPGPGRQPRLMFSQDRYAFGTISITGGPVAHLFRVLNVGEDDLEIAAIATSCGCTTARISADRIPPGESAELVVQFDPSFHPQAGDYTREVYLYSNDPGRPKATLTIAVTTR